VNYRCAKGADLVAKNEGRIARFVIRFTTELSGCVANNGFPPARGMLSFMSLLNVTAID
jgi:hypothetical protein